MLLQYVVACEMVMGLWRPLGRSSVTLGFQDATRRKMAHDKEEISDPIPPFGHPRLKN